MMLLDINSTRDTVFSKPPLIFFQLRQQRLGNSVARRVERAVREILEMLLQPVLHF